MVAPDDHARSAPLSVVNPVAAQHTYLRTSVRPSVLETYANNRHQVDGPLRVFEIGFEYLPVEADLPHERTVLCAALGGTRETRWPGAGQDRLDFFDAKGAVESILSGVGVRATFAPMVEFGLLEGHAAAVRVGKDAVGVLGQVHPENAALFDIEEPVFLLELWVEDLVRHLPERPEYQPASKFPEVRQDLALVVDNGVTAGRILEIARSHRSGAIRLRADVFDEYRGKGVPEGKKSLALRLRFQASDRTLTDADVAKVQQGLVTRLAKELGAEVRGA